jgi:hypothetical protein
MNFMSSMFRGGESIGLLRDIVIWSGLWCLDTAKQRAVLRKFVGLAHKCSKPWPKMAVVAYIVLSIVQKTRSVA